MRTATKSDFPNYTFNEDGTVINNETGAPLTARPSKKGFVFMLKNADSKSKSVLQSEFLTELFPGNDTVEPFSDIDAANEVGITSEGAENEALNLDEFTLPGDSTAAPEPVNEESHIAVQMPSTVYEGGEEGGEEAITTEAPVVSITKGKKGAKAKEAKAKDAGAAKVIVKAEKPAKKKADKEPAKEDNTQAATPTQVSTPVADIKGFGRKFDLDKACAMRLRLNNGVTTTKQEAEINNVLEGTVISVWKEGAPVKDAKAENLALRGCVAAMKLGKRQVPPVGYVPVNDYKHIYDEAVAIKAGDTQVKLTRLNLDNGEEDLFSKYYSARPAKSTPEESAQV